MFKVNEAVIYGTHGVCTVTDIAAKDFMGKKKEYYVLKPLHSTSTTLFAPTDNEAVLAKMRRILSKTEIEAMVDSVYGEELPWIDNNNQRREKFKAILESGDHKSLILMIKAIWLQKQKREAEDKKLPMSDEQFFRDAEQLLYDEFRFVLKISKEDLVAYVFKLK